MASDGANIGGNGSTTGPQSGSKGLPCGNCHRFLHVGDPHKLCFKCRGPLHDLERDTCEDCVSMEKVPRERWASFVSEAKALSSKLNTESQPQSSQFVSSSDFSKFQGEMSNSLSEIFSKLSQLATVPSHPPATGPHGHVVKVLPAAKPPAGGQDRSEDSMRSRGSSDSNELSNQDAPPVGGGFLGAFARPGDMQLDAELDSYRNKSWSDIGRNKQPFSSKRAPEGAGSFGSKRAPEGADSLELHATGDLMDEEQSNLSTNRWDFKRRRYQNQDSEGEGSYIGPDDSVSNVGSQQHDKYDDEDEDEVVDKTSSRDDMKYNLTINKVIDSLHIAGADPGLQKSAMITSSRVKPKSTRPSLPFADDHREKVDQVLGRSGKSAAAYKLDVKNRYRIADSDFNTYVTAPSQLDPFLKFQLRRTLGSKFKPEKPKIPQKEDQNVENVLRKVEQGAAIGLAAGVSQSWLLEYAIDQLSKVSDFVDNHLPTEVKKDFDKSVDLSTLRDAVGFAQDASMDILDLEARQLNHAKTGRRHLWMSYTKWDQSVKTAVLKVPVNKSEGFLCGPSLKQDLKAYKIANEFLADTEARPGRSSGFGSSHSYSTQQKRKFDKLADSHFGSTGAKRQKTRDDNYRSGNRGGRQQNHRGNRRPFQGNRNSGSFKTPKSQ